MMFWFSRGDRWGTQLDVGSLIDRSSPSDMHEAFRGFLDHPGTLSPANGSLSQMSLTQSKNGHQSAGKAHGHSAKP